MYNQLLDQKFAHNIAHKILVYRLNLTFLNSRPHQHKYIDLNMYYALIDSLAAEHSARMQAMEAASKNAKEKVNSLTVEYNKARQAAITTELIEIISGVEALK